MGIRFIISDSTSRLSIATFLLLTLATLSSNVTRAQIPTLGFVATMGGTQQDVAGYSQATDANGNSYIAGTFRGTADFDPGPGTATLTTTTSEAGFVAKYDATGAYLWAFRIGSTRNNWPSDFSLAIDAAGNVVVSGPFTGTFDFDPGAGTANLTTSPTGAQFVAKYTPTGNYLWAFALSSSALAGPTVNCIAIDANGNIVVSGYFAGSVDFNPGAGTAVLKCTRSSNGSPDSFIARYSPTGGHLWSISIRGSKAEWIERAVIDGNGNIYVIGHFEGSAKFNPASQTILTSAGAYDAFVAKYTATGAYTWAFRTGSTGTDAGLALAVDGGGNVYTTGKFQSTVDFNPGSGTANLTSAGADDIFVAKYNSAGNYSWSFRVGAAGYDGSRAIAVDGSGDVLVTGGFGGTIDFDPGAGVAELTNAGLGGQNAFVAKYTSVGNYVWAFSLDGIVAPTSSFGKWIATDAGGTIYVTGNLRGSVDFDPSGSTVAVTSAGDFDIFLAAFSEPLMPKRSRSSALTGASSVPRVAPNPFSHDFTVAFDRASAPTHIEIIDVMGRIVETRVADGEPTELVLGADLQPGAYFVRTYSGESSSIVLVRKVE